MEKFYNETLLKLEMAISDLEIDADCSIHRIETVIHLIIDCLSKLKAYVLERGFKDVNEEIHFFKYQKPEVYPKVCTS